MKDQTNASTERGSEVDKILQKKEFGSSLRIAREKAGLSITDVAENLLISADVIRALENSQADALPALTFTQGYIRSYAKLFNLPAEEIIDAYAYMAPNSKQVLTPHSVLPAQKSTGDIIIKIITFSFIAVAVFVLFTWLYKTDFNIKLDSSSTGFELIPFQTKEQHYQEADEADSAYVLPEEAQDIDVQEPLKASLEVPVDENIEADSSAITEPPVNDNPVFNDELVLTAIGESWVEVQDSIGQKLFYQLLNRGEEIKLKGVAPFTVFLGNAPEVRIEINNKIIDFEHLINTSSNVVNMNINSNAAISLTRR